MKYPFGRLIFIAAACCSLAACVVEPGPIVEPIVEEPDPIVEEPGDPTEVKVMATLSWNAPISREDGSDLANDDIASYEITYIADDGELHTEQVVADTTVWTTTLNEGNYTFAIAATDIYGLKSQLSTSLSCEITPSDYYCN